MMTKEIKVGVFGAIGVAVFVICIVLLGNFQFSKRSTLYILFSDVSGLPPKAPVKISGVDIGNVSKIEFYEGKARVLAKIRKDIPVYKNARASVVATGVIGSKYIDLSMGTSDYPYIQHGDTIFGDPQYSMEVILDKVMTAVDGLMSTVNFLFKTKDGKNGLTSIFDNINNIAEKLDNALGVDGRNVKNIVTNLDELVLSLKNVSGRLDNIITDKETKDIKEFVDNLQDIGSNLKLVSDDLKEGKGISELITDEKVNIEIRDTLTNLREASYKVNSFMDNITGPEIKWEGALNYDLDNDIFRTDAGITLNPMKKNYYYIGVENMSDSQSPLYDKGDQRSNSVSFLAGKNIKNWFVYGGLLKSSGGMGTGLNMFKNKIKFDLSASRFNRISLVGKKAWMSFKTSYKISKWVSLKFIIEDLLEDKTIGASLGIDFSKSNNITTVKEIKR